MNIAHFFLESKTGLYLDLELLDNVRKDTNQNYSIRHYANCAFTEVIRNGEDSLAHLCLTPDVRNAFYRSGLTKISDFREFLETGEWRGREKIRNIGARSKEIAKVGIASFDAEVAKLQG